MSPVFELYGFVINGIKHVTPKEAFELSQKGVMILDVRELFEVKYKMLDIENVMTLPFQEFEELHNQIPKNIPLIIADAVGIRSKWVVSSLIGKGYENVVNLAGGILEWEKDGLPITKDLSMELNGPCACMLNTWNKLKNK